MMRRSALFVALLAIGLVTVTAPGALAQGGSDSRSDRLPVVFATPSLSSAHLYDINLTQGETLAVDLTWQDQATDLDVVITAPGGTCQVTPSPEIPCLVDAAEDTATAAACLDGSGDGESVGLGPSSESTSVDAQEDGTFGVWVVSSTGVPLTTVPYSITVTTSDDGYQDLNQPRPFGLIRSSGHCRGL